MSDLVRYTFSIDRALAAQLERLLQRRGGGNRSKFLCDAIRAQLVGEQWEDDEEALGTITLLYDHHQRQLLARLADLQHDHHERILCTTHVHLDHHRCAEVLMVRGRASAIRDLVDRMRRLKGVLHATLSMSSTGQGID